MEGAFGAGKRSTALPCSPGLTLQPLHEKIMQATVLFTMLSLDFLIGEKSVGSLGRRHTSLSFLLYCHDTSFSNIPISFDHTELME